MVNFKYFGLPLLVGLMSGRTALAEGCSFLVDDNTKAITLGEGATCADGYHLISKTIGQSTYSKMILYDSTDTDNTIKDAVPGIYKPKTKDLGTTNSDIYECTTITDCKTTTISFDVGYFKIGTKYYSCPYDNESTGLASEDQLCKQVAPSSNCSDRTIGQLVAKGNAAELCLAVYENEDGESSTPISLGFATADDTGKVYFVKHVKNESDEEKDLRVFNYDIKANYYALQRTVTSPELIYSSITLKSDYTTNTDTSMVCASATTGEAISRKEDFCNSGAGRYFKCKSGICDSYLQATPTVKELNGESCTLKGTPTASPYTYEGNCVSSTDDPNGYYLVTADYNIVTEASAGAKLIKLTESSFESESETSVKGYYLNADVATKQKYPLIACGSSECQFIASENIKIGYYITNSASSESVIKCTSKVSCEKATQGTKKGNIKIESHAIKLIGKDDYLFDYTNGVDKEYILLDVEIDDFPGVTVKGNYAVQMKVDKVENAETDIAIGTISLLVKQKSCDNLEDNETIKKDDGMFYYCAGGTEVPMKNGGAKFAISVNNKIKIIQISDVKAEELSEEENLGYFVDRTKNSNDIVSCHKKPKENDEDEDEYVCEIASLNIKNEYEVFINQETGFPGSSGVTLDANIIVCSSSGCFVPEKNNEGDYKVGDKSLNADHYFINHEDLSNETVVSLIKCDTIGGTQTCKLRKGDDLKAGIYINGIKNLSLIKCSENTKTDEDGGEDTKYIACETMTSVVQYGHYASFDTNNYIECNNSECYVVAIKDGKTFINSDSTSDKLIITCTTANGCKEVEAGGYYLDSTLGGLNLIKCSESGCVKLEGTNRGVYISDNGNKLITCTTSSCTIKVSENNPNSANQAYYLNGDHSSDLSSPIITSMKKEEETALSKRADTFIWAPMEDKPSANSVFINGNHDNASYGIIYCTSDSSCSEISDTANDNYYIDIINGKVIECGITECEDETVSGTSTLPSGKNAGDIYNFVVNKSNAQLLKTGTGSLLICTYGEKWSCSYESSGNRYYISEFNTNDLIVSSSSGYEIKTYSSLVNGYYINSETEIYKCDGSSKCEKYTITECSSSNVGHIDSDGNICLYYKDENDKIMESINSNKLYIAKVKSFPGVAADKTIIINALGSKVVQVKPSIESYYLVGEDLSPLSKDSEAGTLYKCLTTGECTLSNSNVGYYPNADTTTVKEYPNIKCEKVVDTENSTDAKTVYKTNPECKLSKKTGNEEYCLKKNSTKLYSCQVNCDSDSCIEITPKSGIYLPYERNYLIQCTPSCSKLEITDKGYYISEDAENTLIICNSSTDGYRCEYESNIGVGYYFNGVEKKLINCKSDGSCVKVAQAKTGWFVSGEKGKAILYCEGTGSNYKCSSDAKPALGYYKNGDDTNPLIKCSANSDGSVSCSEIALPNKGYFINASDKDKDIGKYLINCSTGSCEAAEATTGYYYINGENNKLIYCKSADSCEGKTGSGWYLGNVMTSSDIIYCDEKCTKESASTAKKGYYLNADPYTSAKPLIVNSGSFSYYTINSEFSGWYINAGSKSSDDKILECVYGVVSTCTPKEVKSSCVNGNFFDDAGVIKWCINNNEENFIKEGEEARYVFANIPNKTFISWISESSGYAKFKIGKDSVTQVKIDGYTYDEVNSKLYSCQLYGTGICTPKSEVNPGYYINYSDDKVNVILCGKYDGIVCQNIPNESLVETKYDIIKGNSGKTNNKLYLVPVGESEPVIMENLSSENDLLYAITNVKDKAFPKPSDVNYARYILVNVNKYYVKFKENIPEIAECNELPNTDESNTKKVCLSITGNTYKIFNESTGKEETTSTIPININNVNTNPNGIEYDADTNNGYFEYKRDDNGNYVLKTVYLKRNDAKGEFKYECPINGICIRREKAKEPIICYEFDNGIMKKKVRNENSNEISDEKIMPGIYIKCNDNGVPDKDNFINCEFNSVDNNVVCSLISKDTGITYSATKNEIQVRVDGSNISSSKLFTKLVKNQKVINYKRSLEKRDTETILILKELTATSYNEATFDKITNVFLYSNFKKITNEVLSNEEEVKVKAYTCNSNGECLVIDTKGNPKYFLNSAQKGNSKNAVVVCGNIDTGDTNGRCRFIDAKADNVYENYAAKSSEDALIVCTATECTTKAAVISGSLPVCQKNIIGAVDIDISSKSCIRSDNSKPLLEGQHCILEGVIYKYNGSTCDKINGYESGSGSRSGMKLFDATFREISIPNISENHYGSILYNCPLPGQSGGCYVTYGYIANTSKSSKGYSICNTNGCMYKSINQFPLSSSCEEEGGLVYENETIKLCKKGGSSTNSEGYHSVKITTNEKFPTTLYGDTILVNIEIKSTTTAIYSLVINDGYILVNNENTDNKIININNHGNTDTKTVEKAKALIYYCTSSNRSCINIVEPENGYYRSASYPTDLITIGLVSSNKEQIKMTTGYDGIIGSVEFSENENTNYYYPLTSGFPGSSFGVIVKASKYSITKYYTDNYVLVNTYENRLATKTETRDMKNLYLCNSSVGKCVKQTIEDGWYVSGQSNYEAIKCEKESCSMIESIGRSCSGEGDFIITDNEYAICIMEKSMTKYKIKENIGKVSELTYSKIAFPNNKTYIVVNANSVKGIGYRDENNGTTPSGITICKSYTSTTGICLKNDGTQLKNGEYCLFGNKIYSNVTESGSTVSSCTQKFTSGVSVEVFYGSELISTLPNTRKVIYGTQMYYCKDGSCSLTSGYKKLGSNWYKCNYGSCNINTSGTEYGDLDGSNLRTPEGSKSISDGKYYYIYGSNNFPGAENYKSFIVQMGSNNYAIPFIGNGYYLINSSKAEMLSTDPRESTTSADKTGNKLYLCNNVNNNCEMLNSGMDNMVENKFYRNAASSDPLRKAIIGCYNDGNYSTNCVIADGDTIVYDETVDKCEYAGYLVSTTSAADANGKITYGEYKLCTERDKSPVAINIDSSKYYMITITRKDRFAGIELKDDDTFNDVKRNIIVEVGNGYVSQYEKEGYILFNPTTNEIVEKAGNNRGKLYYCERSKNYDTDTRYSYACDVVTSINNGWYFNEIYGDKRAIRCVDSTCTIVEVESSSCINSGSLIYNNGFKVCQSTEKQIDISSVNEEYNIVMNVKLLNEFPGLKTNNTEILLSVSKNSAYHVKMKTNVVVNDDNVVLDSGEGNLYECYADGHCSVNLIPKDNYYIKSNSEGKDVELILCENRKCKVVQEKIEGKGHEEGFRIGTNSQYPLIQCAIAGELNEENKFIPSGDGIAECKEKSMKEGWYINSGSDSSLYPLIRCSKESGCVSSIIQGEGWYINAGANNEYSKFSGVYNSVIKCENNSCTYLSEDFESECKKGGSIIKTSGSVKLCKEEGKSIDFKNGSIEIINLEGSKIAVVTTATNIVNADDGNYYITSVSPNIMYECLGTCKALNSDEYDGKYVYDNISSLLMYASCSSGSCTWTSVKNEGNYFIDNSGYLVTSKANTEINEIYECTKNSKNTIICTEVLKQNTIGYFFNNEIKDQEGKQESILYLCSGVECNVKEDIPKCTELKYKTNYCYISYNDEDYVNDTNQGKEPKIEGGEICISESKYYFAINEINTGIDSLNCVSLPSDSNNYYYQVNKSGNAMIYLQNKFGARRVYVNSSLVNGLNTSLVISTKKTNNGIILEDNGNYVVCTGDECVLNKINSCTYSIQSGKCTVSSSTVNPGQLCLSTEGNYYLALEKLTSNGGKCVNHKTSWSYSIGSDTVNPDYSDVLKNVSKEKYEETWFVVDGKMYKIEKLNDIYLQNEGVYLIDSANKRVFISENKSVDISKESQFKLYICNSQGCKEKSSCSNGSSYEYIYDSENEKLIQCDPKTTTISYVNNPDGYYLNSPWEDVIKCINGICIEYDSNIGMEGYYYDAGNSEKIIKCVRNGSSFKCINENVIECEYNSKDKTCSSQLSDLKRNSYCVYINRVKGKTIGSPIMLYVENFIRKEETGDCIYNGSSKEIYYHYRKSKFLDHEEKNEIIRYSKGAIVSVYEKDIGYYIINTNDRVGITSNVKLNKSRMYECTSSGCVEQRTPVSGRIYINKASTEKMVRYENGSWVVMKRRCAKNTVNVRQCILENPVNKGDIIYMFEDGYLEPEFMFSKVRLSTKNTLIEDNNEKIDVNKYHYLSTEGNMYVLNSNKQSFDRVSEKGYYMFKTSDNYYNLEPYRSTVNTTDTSNIQYYYYNGSWEVAKPFSFTKFVGGYYWNKASPSEGIAIQVMNVPPKQETEEESGLRKRDENENVDKFKSVINVCASVKKGTCTSAQEGKSLAKGDVCIVTDGDFRGLYLAIDNITKSSSGNNCLRYDTAEGYFYVGGKYEFSGEPLTKTISGFIEFAGQPLLKTIIKVGENSINPFTESTTFGYYVIEKTERKLLSSTTSIASTGYLCGWEYDPYTEGENAGTNNPETKRYECNSVKATNKYFHTVNGEKVLAKTDSSWYIETKRGYYFFNNDFVAASITKDTNDKQVADSVIYSHGVSRVGYYINSAASSAVVVQNDSNGKKTIKLDIKLCQISGDNCTPKETGVEFSDGEVCYASNKSNILSLVRVTEVENVGKKYNCYSGSEKIKYRYASNILYRLDGLSVQVVPKGYYILNKSWEEFTATYPEVPTYVFKCDGSKCDEITEKIELNSDVIVNEAGTGNNRLLRYYPEFKKFVNVFKPGYYLLNTNSEVTKISGTSDYVYRYYLDDNGKLGDLPSSFKYDNIYINNAKEGSLTRFYSEFEDSKVKLNQKTGFLEYNGVASDDDEVKYMFIGSPSVLYTQKPYHFEEVSDGLYAIKDGVAFESTEWTQLTNEKEICYYVGSCDSSRLSRVKNGKYTLNYATKKPSVIEYDKTSNSWRMVKEDGFYFLFEDEYSIDSTDRRIDRVFEVLEGESIEITKDANRFGYYKFNGMTIESNENEGWVDGVLTIDTVDVEDKRICQSYETDEVITTDKFCHDDELGVCIPRSDITNTSEEKNCIFSEESGIYYFLIGDQLYSVSKTSFRNIKKSGLYVVNSNKKIFENKLESKAIAYACKNGSCKLENELSTGYYLNMANGGLDDPAILYYNSASGTWRETAVDGYYLFNAEGYAVGDGEEVAFAYKVEENGNEVYSVLDENDKGFFINQSSGDETVLVEFSTKWEKAKKVPGCKISGGKVTTSEEMKVGDVCIDGKKMVIISGGTEASRRKREFTYDGITSEGSEQKYSFNESEKSIVKLEEGVMTKLEVTGYVVIDKETNMELSSVDPVEAKVYQCDSGKCEVVDESTLEAGTHVVNRISSESPLVKLEEGGVWKVETEKGFYFFNSEFKAVESSDVVESAIEVEFDSNNVAVQRDITTSNELGFYFNKAAKSDVLLSNDISFWSKGSSLYRCNITIEESGAICRTMKETLKDSLDSGDYCYDGEKIYLLTASASEEVTETNCISGSNDEPLFVTPDIVSSINGMDVGTKLIRLRDDSIKVVSPGIYIINENGTLIDDNDNGKVKMQIFTCDENGCDENSEMEKNVKFLSETGDIFEIQEDGSLMKVVEEGIYFFKDDGTACTTEGDSVSTILELTKVDEAIVKEKKSLDELSIGAYINSANVKSIGIYDGESWTIEERKCEYVEDKQVCTSESGSLEVGDFCIVEGKIYIVTKYDEEAQLNYCLPGNDEVPIYFVRDEAKLMVVKEKSANIVDDDGYYAVDVNTKKGLKSDTPVVAKFYKCEVGMECNEIKPEKSSKYLNKAVADGNIVNFNEKGSLKEVTSNETHCTVDGHSCSVEEGELEAGDVCVAENALYLVKDDKQCVMAETYVERYQFVNGKMYKLVADTVVQKFDGYFFVNGDSRAISSAEDYSNPDTVGYMCSVKGDCIEIIQSGLRYYKDYTTVSDGKYKVVKFDPTKKSKRDGGHSGYEALTEGGIYRLDDGSYADCEVENNDEVSCKDIEEVGAKFTVDGEIVLCSKENKKVGCVQATEGGYYVIYNEDEDRNIVYECDASEEGDKLVCEEIMKEGYFLANGKDVLYECVERVEEENVDVSNVMNGLFDGVESTDSVETEDEIESEVVEVVNKREEEEPEEGQEGKAEGEEEGENKEDEGNAETPETPEPKGPVEVDCKKIDCTEGFPVNTGGENGVDLYVCMKVEKKEEEAGDDNDNDNEGENEGEEEEEEEEDELQWVCKNCESGNYLKKDDGFYDCEEKKEGIKEEYIEKPNEEKTSTIPKDPIVPKTTTKTTTTTDEPEVTTTTTTPKESTATTSKSTGGVVETTTTTTTGKTTTTTTTTSKTTTTATATTTTPSGSSLRSIPSIALYVVLFLFYIVLQF